MSEIKLQRVHRITVAVDKNKNQNARVHLSISLSRLVQSGLQRIPDIYVPHNFFNLLLILCFGLSSMMIGVGRVHGKHID